MSIVCVICSWQPFVPEGHMGRTSIDMLCHEASNSLCPSKRLDIPALPLHGNNLRNGVKFSVHTTSLGSVPCRRCRFDIVEFEWSPAGWKDNTGLVVLVESMKFSDAQKSPDRAFVNVSHRPSALGPSVNLASRIVISFLLFIRLCIHPSPQLHACSSLPSTSPGPCTPAFCIPSPKTKPQM